MKKLTGPQNKTCGPFFRVQVLRRAERKKRAERLLKDWAGDMEKVALPGSACGPHLGLIGNATEKLTG